MEPPVPKKAVGACLLGMASSKGRWRLWEQRCCLKASTLLQTQFKGIQMNQPEATYPRAAPNAQPSPMSQAFGQLNSSLGRINKELSDLRERVSPVSHGTDICAAEVPKDDDSSVSQHVREVRGYAVQASQLADEIRAL